MTSIPTSTKLHKRQRRGRSAERPSAVKSSSSSSIDAAQVSTTTGGKATTEDHRTASRLLETITSSRTGTTNNVPSTGKRKGASQPVNKSVRPACR